MAARQLDQLLGFQELHKFSRATILKRVKACQTN